MSKLNSLILKLKMFMHIQEVNLFFSQTGEDVLINGVLNNQQEGFYVDVGAFDPVKYSNTFAFYLKGWRGINIDPNPESITKFNKARPKDKNINVGISDCPEQMIYYQYENPAFNTFSRAVSKQYGRPIKESIVRTYRLDKVLDQEMPPGGEIDLLNVDTEGFDLFVLKSNDWKRFRPKVIAVEFNKNDNSIDNFLKKQNYKLICNTILTKIFVDANGY